MDFESFHSDLIQAINKLPGESKKMLFLKTKNKINLIKIDGNDIYVATDCNLSWKNFDEFKKFDVKLLHDAFDELLKGEILTQDKLQSKLNSTNSAFIIAAFDLLSCIKYFPAQKSIKLDLQQLKKYPDIRLKVKKGGM